MKLLQEILISGDQISINGKQHTLNMDFCQYVDNFSIHVSLDANNNITLFECGYTIVNGDMATDAYSLASLFGLTIDNLS